MSDGKLTKEESYAWEKQRDMVHKNVLAGAVANGMITHEQAFALADMIGIFKAHPQKRINLRFSSEYEKDTIVIEIVNERSIFGGKQ